jgi:hypothetical protein
MQNSTLFLLSLACHAAESGDAVLAENVSLVSRSILSLSVLRMKAAREGNLAAADILQKQSDEMVQYGIKLIQQANSNKNGDSLQEEICDGSGGMAGHTFQEKRNSLGFHGSMGQGGPEPRSLDQHGGVDR